MKTKTGYLLPIIAVIVFISALIFAVYTFSPLVSLNESPQAPEYQYIIKARNSEVAVYSYEDDKFLYTLDVPLNSLPEYDVNSIKIGIKIHDEQELKDYIEDFTS